VSEEDGLPDLICEQCISVVNRFYRYQQQCWNADAKLRCLLKKPARDPSEQSPPHHANTPPNKPESSPPETCERSFTEDLQSDDQTSSESPSSIPKNRTFSQSQLSRVPNNTKKDSTHKISKQCKQSSISRKQYTSTEKKNCHNDRTPSSSLSLSTEQKYSAPAEKRIVTSQASSCQTKNGSTSHHIKAQKSSTFSEYKASHNASVTPNSEPRTDMEKTVLEAETGPSSTDIEELSSKIVHSDNKSDDIDVILKSEPVELIELIGEDGSEEEDPFNDKIEDLNTKIKSEPLNTIVLSDESSDVECNVYPVEELKSESENEVCYTENNEIILNSKVNMMQNLAIDVMKLSNMELVASSCNAESISSDGNTLVVRSMMNNGIRSELKQDLCSKPEIKSVSPVKCSVVIDDCEASEDGIDSNIRKQNNSHFKAHSSESGALSTIEPKEEPDNDSIMLHESGSLNNLNSRHTSTLSPLTQGKNDLSATKFFKMAQVEEKLENLPSPSNENETTVEESLSDMKPLWKIEKKIEEDNIEELHEHEVIDLTSDSDDDTFPWTYDEDIVNCTYDTSQESNYHVTSPLIEDESTLELDSSIAQIPRNKQLNSPHIIGATELSNTEETQVGGMSRDDNINEVSEDGDYSPWKFEKVNVVTSKDENFSSGRQSSPSNESQDANEQSRPTNEILGGVFQTEEEDESTERNKTNKMPLSKSLVRYYHDRENNVRYSCTLCSRSYTTPWDLKKHEFTHTGVRPHVCEQCGKSFSLKASLRRHEKIHTGLEKRRYPCDICGKTFSQVTYLSHHRMSHGEEGLPFTCFHCGKAFAMKYHLKSHMRVHMGDRPYQCDICNNTFSMEEKLAEHKRKHTGKQLHKCFECGKTFTKRCYLSRHMGRHSKRREIAENQPDSLKIDTAHMIQSELS
ncbi:hypothetical protein ANN_18344, partial [Periplaneta americana]